MLGTPFLPQPWERKGVREAVRANGGAGLSFDGRSLAVARPVGDGGHHYRHHLGG